MVAQKIKQFLNYPWQGPVFAIVTVYGIYSYGWLDWRVISMGLVTLFFVWLNIVRLRKNK